MSATVLTEPSALAFVLAMLKPKRPSRNASVVEGLRVQTAAMEAKRKTVPNEIEIHRVIRAGLPGSALAVLKFTFGFDNKRLGEMIGVRGDKTVAQRLTSEHLPAIESDRAFRLLRLFSEAVRAFDDDWEEAAQWFREPSVRLGGARPMDFVDTDEGARLVSNTLIAIDHGLPV